MHVGGHKKDEVPYHKLTGMHPSQRRQMGEMSKGRRKGSGRRGRGGHTGRGAKKLIN